MLFCAMEEVVREYLHSNKVHHMTEGFKSTVVKAIMENEEVLFHWCMLTAESEDKDAEVVFGMLVDMWITVRGFSFASQWLEVYKREKINFFKDQRHYVKTLIKITLYCIHFLIIIKCKSIHVHYK